VLPGAPVYPGFIPVDTTDRQTLENIALSNAFTNGNAVFSARALLGMDVNRNYGFNQQKLPGSAAQSAPAFQVYPNPVGKRLIVKGNVDEEAEVTIEIRDVMGQKVLVSALDTEKHSHRLSTACLAPGIYFYSIRINRQHVDGGKFVKQ